MAETARTNVAAAPLDVERVRLLIARERERLAKRTHASASFYREAAGLVPGGVHSSFQWREPYPIYLADGEGSRVWDVDGNEYVDFHAGYGALVVGHAHPALRRALGEAAARGTQFAAPTVDSLPVAEELHRRFGLPLWRFCNSGTEATMGAVRLARALTGRPLVAKIEGAYHGHHDAALVSVLPSLDAVGPATAPLPVPASAGIPDAVANLTRPIPFNDPDALDRILGELGGRVACLLVELPLLTPPIIPPAPGYVEAIQEITRRHGVLLILDEIKTGVVLAEGGATQLFGIEPDLVTLGKAFGGGLPCGAIGGGEETMRPVASGAVGIYGTFNGNPLMMAAAHAALVEVLTPSAYQSLRGLGDRLAEGCRRAVADYGIPTQVVSFGARGCLTMTPAPAADYRQWQATVDRDLIELVWLHQLNRGVYASPTPRAQWMVTVAHREDDVDRFVANLAELAAELRDARRGA